MYTHHHPSVLLSGRSAMAQKPKAWPIWSSLRSDPVAIILMWLCAGDWPTSNRPGHATGEATQNCKVLGCPHPHPNFCISPHNRIQALGFALASVLTSVLAMSSMPTGRFAIRRCYFPLRWYMLPMEVCRLAGLGEKACYVISNTNKWNI